MATITSNDVLKALSSLSVPGVGKDIVASGLVSDVFISDGKVYFSITVPAERARELEPLRASAEKIVKGLPGVRGAVVALTADRKAAPSDRPAAAKAAAQAPPNPPDAPKIRTLPAISASISLPTQNIPTYTHTKLR